MMAKSQSRERGFFGDVVIIHDRGGSRPPPVKKPWRMCGVSGCKGLAVDRHGEEFVCAPHGLRSAAE